jgi:hypothetical protein
MLHRFIIFTVLVIVVLFSNIGPTWSCFSQPPYCISLAGDYMRCENFTNFGELIFTNESNECSQLELRPFVPLLFNHTLNLTGINITGSLSISNLIGIDISKQLIINQPAVLAITESQFSLYYDGVLIDTLEKCNNMEIADVSKSVLKHSRLLDLQNNNYIGEMCPYLFRINESIIFDNITIQNRLSFMNVKPQTTIDLNPNFNSMEFLSGEIYLDEALMNHLVFGNLKIFGILGTKITQLQSSVFKSFRKLSAINFGLKNMSEFVRETKNEWLSSLNSDVKIDFDNQSSIDYYRSREMYVNLGIYDYPGEDFCYFHRFPVQRLVFAVPTPFTTKECTCTVIWLLQFYALSSNISILLNEFTLKCSANLFQLVENCKFDEKIKACNDTSPTTVTALISSTQPITTEKKPEASSNTIYIIIISILSVLLLACVGYFVFIWYKNRNNKGMGYSLSLNNPNN